MYLLSDLFTYYEHDPDLHHDDETPAEADSPDADSPGADAPTGDDLPPDLAHVAVVTT